MHYKINDDLSSYIFILLWAFIDNFDKDLLMSQPDQMNTVRALLDDGMSRQRDLALLSYLLLSSATEMLLLILVIVGMHRLCFQLALVSRMRSEDKRIPPPWHRWSCGAPRHGWSPASARQ